MNPLQPAVGTYTLAKKATEYAFAGLLVINLSRSANLHLTRICIIILRHQLLLLLLLLLPDHNYFFSEGYVMESNFIARTDVDWIEPDDDDRARLRNKTAQTTWRRRRLVCCKTLLRTTCVNLRNRGSQCQRPNCAAT
jgi:hypothetical protein